MIKPNHKMKGICMRTKILFVIGLALIVMSCKKELQIEVMEKHANGAKKKEIYYYNRKTDPRRIILYSTDGKVMSDRFLKNGKPDSVTVIYHSNGNKYKESMYIQDNTTKKEMKHGTETSWYEDGKVKSSATFENGNPVGSATTYYGDGTKASEVTYKDGAKDGAEIDWYPDGKEKELVTYKNGDRNGPLKHWYSNGNLKKEDTYVNNAMNGLCCTYHENGKKESECTYKEGRLEGEKKEWYENGKLAAKATYEKGVLMGGTRY